MIDVLGRIIGEGDVVTYPVRQGSYLWVNAGRVLSVESDHIRVLKYEEGEGRVVSVRNTENVTIVERDIAIVDRACMTDTLLGV